MLKIKRNYCKNDCKSVRIADLVESIYHLFLSQYFISIFSIIGVKIFIDNYNIKFNKYKEIYLLQ